MTNKELINKINNDIIIDLDNGFEPVDTEGWEMAGLAEYNGKKYPVTIFLRNIETIEMQAVKQIAGEITKNN